MDIPDLLGLVDPKRCGVAGCGRTVVARGFCWMHYQRKRRGLDPYGPTPQEVKSAEAWARLCNLDGCERPARFGGLGYCPMHYGRVRATGDPGPVESLRVGRKPVVACAVAGCERPTFARGWCQLHWARRQYGRDMLAPIGFGHRRSYPAPACLVATCSVDGCERPVYARGVCRSDYSRLRHREKIAERSA